MPGRPGLFFACSQIPALTPAVAAGSFATTTEPVSEPAKSQSSGYRADHFQNGSYFSARSFRTSFTHF